MLPNWAAAGSPVRQTAASRAENGAGRSARKEVRGIAGGVPAADGAVVGLQGVGLTRGMRRGKGVMRRRRNCNRRAGRPPGAGCRKKACLQAPALFCSKLLASVPVVLHSGVACGYLAIHAGTHDSSAAAFDDYQLVAAVSGGAADPPKGRATACRGSRSTRCCASPAGRARDVDAIATTRALVPTHYLRLSAAGGAHYTFDRWRGRERAHARARGASAIAAAPPTRVDSSAPTAFCGDHSFRPDTQIHFANHHEAHALAALFYTDWNDALIYTSDGIGDNVSYSMRSLKDGKLDCHFGDDRWLLRKLGQTQAGQRLRLRDRGLRLPHAAPRGQAHRPRRLWRAEARRARWRPFPLRPNDGLIEPISRNEVAMREKFLDDLQGPSPRETIAASIQKVAEDFIAAVGALLARSAPARAGSALAGGLFANVRLNRLLAETCRSTRCSSFRRWATTACRSAPRSRSCTQRDGTATWLRAAPPARQRLSRPRL